MSLANPQKGEITKDLDKSDSNYQFSDVELDPFPVDVIDLALQQIVLLERDIPLDQMPALYKSVDAFVLPSRGEGWGRPHVEAMSMELPVIATFWSGPTAYMTEENSYPLMLDGMCCIQG